MYIGDNAELVMEKLLLSGGSLEQEVLKCKIIGNDEAEERFFMVLEDGELPRVSLDAIYKCTIETKEERIYCDGMVKERYKSEDGDMVVFQIENGFYQL